MTKRGPEFRVFQITMRIYRGKIKPISEDVVKTLIEGEDIEVEEDQVEEVVLDVEAIIKEYLRMDEQIAGEAREIIQKQGASYTEFGKVKRMLAEEKDFETGDAAMRWIANQIIESFMYNNRVEEVYSEDHKLRVKIAKVFDQYLGLEEQVDREIRDKIKNIEEGTEDWNIEYKKLYEKIARRKGLL